MQAFGHVGYNAAMLARVVALSLFFFLLWSGLSTFETSGAFAHAPPEQGQTVTLADEQVPSHDGSMEHLHLDERLSQTQSDPPADPPGLLPTPLKPNNQSLVMAQPHAFVLAAVRPPFLAGLLRPPCCHSFTG